MKQYFKQDEWVVIEEGFDPKYNRVAESVMSLGNGHMGTRGNFEEDYSGDSLQGTYYAGVYYTDKTKVGWWKNGYPEWFAKVLNGINFIGIHVWVNGRSLDLSKCLVQDFKRILNMKEGYLLREFTATLEQGDQVRVRSKRFLSMAESEVAALEYEVTPINGSMTISFAPYLDAHVKNEDSNYDEYFWSEVKKCAMEDKSYLTAKTNRLDFHVTCAMTCAYALDGQEVLPEKSLDQLPFYVAENVTRFVEKGTAFKITKYICAVTNRDYDNDELIYTASSKVMTAKEKGFLTLFKEHVKTWHEKWRENDIVIKGDVAAQQAIRFNIFHLNQTYTGEDARLNIGPKGFTGEKYGGSTYWDTEAYCIPFYLSTAPSAISRNLLIYRYNQLEKAKENAKKLGLSGALYPMVTMNGEECHNEWEITFEEIHRNGAIAYAIYNYVRYTGDESYLSEYGFEVLCEISRFWASRVNFNQQKNCYMILGVTGPNEYENNVNNNWYTNTLAAWTLQYTLQVLEQLMSKDHARCNILWEKLHLEEMELVKWQDIMSKMYTPEDATLGVFLQQDGFMDKDLMPVKNLDPKELPLNHQWSWDRILRSCFIKQADVLQGLYFFNDRYDLDTIKRNFDFYEPMTVHESSLSPCIHAILASQIGYLEKAYEMYLRTSRLDLDNYNHDTQDGLHITSMAGTWMSVVHGFGGMKVKNDHLVLSPFKPDSWEMYGFKIVYRGRIVDLEVGEHLKVILREGDPLEIEVCGKLYKVSQEIPLVI